MIQRQNTYVGLHKQPILIVDNTDYSDYFRIDEFPSELTSGKNMFKIYGNDDLLEKGSEILIEVIDETGKPVYHQVNKYRDISGHRVISIFVYDTALAGICRVTILGVATRRPNGRRVPRNWEGRHNVRWSRFVALNPDKPNLSRIIFENAPSIKVEEINREYMYYDFKIGDKAFQSLTQGTITSYAPEPKITYTGYHSSATAVIKFADHVPVESGGGFNPDMREVLLRVGGLTTAHFDAHARKRYGNDAEITYLDPLAWAKKGMLDSGRYGHIKPLYMDTEGTYPDWQPVVLEVKDDNTLLVDALIVPVQVRYPAGGILTEAMAPDFLIDYPNHTNFTTSYHQVGTDTAGKSNIQSFARMTVKNLEPVSGDVYKIKTYMRSQGFGPYTMIGEEEVEDNNLMNDVNASTPYRGAGYFANQSIVDNLWSTTATWGSVNATQSNSPIMGGVMITGSGNKPGDLNPRYSKPWSTQGIVFKSNVTIDVYAGNTYSITFEAAAEKEVGQTEPSTLEMWISGSNVEESDEVAAGYFGYLAANPSGTGLGNIRAAVLRSKLDSANREQLDLLGSNTIANQYAKKMTNEWIAAKGPGGALRFVQQNALANAHIPSSRTQNRYKLTLPSKFTPNEQQVVPGIVTKQLVQYAYTPTEDGNINIRFNTYAGRWFIGNVEVRGERQTGFTPNHTFLEFPIPTAQQDDVLDFKFEFYNRNMEESNLALTVNSVDFSGSNLYIDGANNELPGTLKIGDGFVMEGFDGTV